MTRIGNTPSAWATHQLTDFLAAVTQADSLEQTLMTATERAAEAFAAEVGAILRHDAVAAILGVSAGERDADILAAARPGGPETIEVAGAGPCHVAVAQCDGDDTCRMLVARRAEAFTPEERGLLRSMMRTLTLTLENRRLVDQLNERRELLERLARIQRSISHRAALRDILADITVGLTELLGAEIAVVRLLDPDDPTRHHVAAQRGLPAKVAAELRGLPNSAGVGGQAIVRNELVVAEDYATFAERVRPLVAFGVQAMMAAPVHEGGQLVGSISVATLDPTRAFSESEQEALQAFAEHTSLALTDAQALAGMRRALYDPLTALPNRSYFSDELHTALRERDETAQVAVLFIDIDRFKSVNDSLGHQAGDELLGIVADRISASVRPQDLVARMGGDEFTVLIRNVLHAREAETIAERISEAIAAPAIVAGTEIVPSASIGIAFDDPTQPLGADLVHAADTAMYDAKAAGRGGVRTYRRDIGERARRRLGLETALRSALDHNGLQLHYQPLIDLRTGAISAVEALLRWPQSQSLGITVPEIIAVAEDTGLIHGLGAWAIEAACGQHAAWRKAMGSAAPGLHVNLSGHQLRDPAIASSVADALARTGTHSGALTLEITESVLIGNDGHSQEAIAKLRALGVHLSLDDFGKGYSSLAYLADLDIQSLKIDRGFIERLTDNDGAGVIVQHVIGMAQQLGMAVIAEGTETHEQLELLRALGSNLAQGYLFSRPIPASEMTTLLESKRGELSVLAGSTT